MKQSEQFSFVFRYILHIGSKVHTSNAIKKGFSTEIVVNVISTIIEWKNHSKILKLSKYTYRTEDYKLTTKVNGMCVLTKWYVRYSCEKSQKFGKSSVNSSL